MYEFKEENKQMADFNYFLNRQGPRGMQGEKGEKGNDGNTPTFYAGVDSGTQYTLIIDMGDGNTFETSNLMPTFVNTGGTYLRYDTVNNRYVSAQADMADLSGNIGEVKLATTTSVANETVQDSDAVSYELFRQSGGGGGGTSFIPGTGLELTNADVLNVKIDNSTITTNASGQLVASGGGTTYTAGDAIDLTGDAISVKTDGTTIGLNASNELELKATIPAAQIQSDWTQADNTKVDFIKNKPTLGSLASKNTVDYTTDITNKPTLGSLAAKDTVDYTTDVTNKPTIGAGIITFTQGSTTLGTIDVNQTTATTINIPSSGGGGGGSTYAAGNGIEISAADVISAKVDNSTIGFTAGGELELKATIPTDTGDLTNNAGYITSSALSGYATETWVGNQGYLTGITSGDVTTALGYTPYSSANPDGYTSNVGTVTSVNNTSPDGSGNVTLSIPAAQVQADWDEADSSSKAYILNKPTIPDTTNMVTTNTTQTISSTKTFSTETHFTGNLTFDSALGTPIIRGMSGSSHRNMITRSNTYSTVTTGNTSDNLILKGALTRPKYSHDSSDGGYLALYSDIPGDMTGAAAGTAGAHGLVPAPAAGDNEKFLRGDGTWQAVSSGGSATDVQVNGTSITASNIANIVTEGVYDSSTNKIATMDDVPTDCISGSEVLSPLEYTTTTVGVQKFNYTGSTGVVSYADSYGVNANPPNNTFQYISELTNGVNFITTTYLANSSSTDEVQSIINLGTYSNGTFTTIIAVYIKSGSQYAILCDNLLNGLCDFSLSGYPVRNNAYEANDKTVFCLSYDSSLQKITAAYSTPDSSNNNLMVYRSLDDVNSTNYPDLVTKLGQCTHIQVAFINNDSSATVTSMNIDNMVLTNPSTSYVSSLDTTDADCLMDAVAVDTNLYTSATTNHNLVLNYDSSTLDVDNGALKVKDNTFITETSLQTVHCVIETYQSGTSWYRLYDDGWVEQGGITAGTTNAFVSQNLLITMSDENYNVTVTRLGTTADSATCDRQYTAAINRTTNSFQCWDLYGQYKACWEVKGYAAQT